MMNATAVTLFTCLDGTVQVACPTDPPAAEGSLGLIIGIAVAVVLVALAVGAWFWYQRRSRLGKAFGAGGPAYVQDIELHTPASSSLPMHGHCASSVPATQPGSDAALAPVPLVAGGMAVNPIAAQSTVAAAAALTAPTSALAVVESATAVVTGGRRDN